MGSGPNAKHVVGLDRVSPQAIDAERAVLGALMLPDAGATLMADVADVITSESFYKIAHGHIFTACQDLFALDTPIDLLTVTKQLDTAGHLEKAGGVPELNEMIESCPSAANAVYYAREVEDAAIRRKMVSMGARISSDAFLPEFETDEIIASAEKAIMEIRRPDPRKLFSPIKDSVTSAFKHVQAMFQSGETIIGIPTGFSQLDKRISGLQKSQYIVVGGRPGMGKSGFIQNILGHVGVVLKKGTVLFSLETSAEQFTMRLLSSVSQVDFQRLKSGHLHEDEWPKLTLGAGEISAAPIWIGSQGALSVAEMRSQLRQAQRSIDVELIMVDYMQLMSSENKNDNRVDKLTNISAGLKGLAQEFNCPLLAVSQLSRKVEERPDKRPELSDLRESGALEQDADIVWLIYREGYYDNAVDPKKTEVIIAKHKDGPTGIQKFNFDMSTMTFEEASHETSR